ncbi:MAG TPA: exodeoxyribonuclease VII small subunit [Candidatus Marinimicrobia bacterium]|jgi:exodeoxyribonuclease VII small subunit|nr:exodeoxyribonuclease VII small subunit [Candidatus Neomarinimicrobiota bacterium]|tara:strand:- start:2598 stop:2834 length:237 start_codon:yes stop_codon:yes gene_type:complete
MSEKKTDPKSIEEIFGRLESIISNLESGDIPLDKSLTLFEEGMTLAESCRAQLNAAEQKVQELMKDKGGFLEKEDGRE